jgi:ubiquinone/menaquinone biosynthesis C-methylase UbiE
MAPLLQIFLGLVILFVVVTTGWRLVSRRSSIPCPSWLAWLVELDNPFAKNYNAQSIIKRLDLKPGMRVLDAGCGPGRITIPLARALGTEGKVVAIDIQPGMLRRAAQKAQAAGLANVEFFELSLGAGKLERNQYDRAVLVAVLGEVTDRRAPLQEIYDALVPGGILSISEIVFDPHYQSRGTILKLATPVGFQEKAFFGNRLAFTLQLEKSAWSE